MTQQEFFERTGIKTTADEFDGINRIYMAAGTMDKDTFCQAYKGLGKEGAKIAIELKFAVEGKQKDIDELRQKLIDMALFLIGKAHIYSDTDFRKQAAKVVGERAVVTQTLKMNLPLFEEDIEYITENLK